MSLENDHYCDFCGDRVYTGDEDARIYDAEDFQRLEIGFKGAWLACKTCAAFIRQYDAGHDEKAKNNLARRAIEKYRRKYNIRGMSDAETNKILIAEVTKLHEQFWAYRKDAPPVPYATKRLGG